MKSALVACVAAGLLGLSANVVAAAPPASAFAALPEMSMVRLSPNGQRVAWTNDPGGTPLIVVFDLVTGKDLRRLQPSNSRVRDLDWADDRTLIISVSRSLTVAATTIAERRYEFERYLALDVDDSNGEARSLLMEDPERELVSGATLEKLHAAAPGIVMMSTLSFSSAAKREKIGTRISSDRKDSGFELSLFEVATANGNGRKVESGSPYTDQWILDAAGRAVGRVEWNPESHQYSILAKSAAGWKSIYSSSDYDFHLAGLSADGKSLLAKGSGDSSRDKVWSLPLAGGKPVLTFEHPEFDVTSVVFDRFSDAPTGFWIGGPTPIIHWIDPKMDSIQKAVSRAFPNKGTQVLDRSADYKRIIVHVESGSSPPVYYLVDFTNKSADIIGESYPALTDATLGAVQTTSYKAPDGFEIPAYLTMPPGLEPKSLPLVVFPHGGPYARDTGGFDWWAQFLATRGYVVLQPQFRGSTGYGADFARAGNRQWGRGMQDDITAGVRELIAKGVVDPKRVCIVGASYGGYAALAGAAFTPDLYVCAASINGIADIPQMLGFVKEKWGGEESDAFDHWKRMTGNASDEAVVASSPSRSVDTIRAPILLIHGSSDTVVPPSQSRNFAQLLKQKGKQCELVELPGEDHWLSTGQSRLTMLQSLEAFLAANLR